MPPGLHADGVLLSHGPAVSGNRGRAPAGQRVHSWSREQCDYSIDGPVGTLRLFAEGN